MHLRQTLLTLTTKLWNRVANHTQVKYISYYCYTSVANKNEQTPKLGINSVNKTVTNSQNAPAPADKKIVSISPTVEPESGKLINCICCMFLNIHVYDNFV